MNTTTTPDIAARWAPTSGSMARRSAPRWVRWVGWLIHNPVPVLALTAVVALGATVGPVATVTVVAVSAVGCAVWARRHRRSWDATGGRVLLGAWRCAWTYGVRWRASMIFVGLAGSLDGHEWVPRVVRVRAGRFVDRVTVRIVVGQQPDDWARRADALAHAFGARSCQVTMLAGRPGFVELTIGRADPLAQVVPALPVPEHDAGLDLSAVPVGVTEAGERWRLDVTGGRHTLIAGVTGAGKGSVVWSLLRGLGPAVASGRVQVWCCDPKGGMELAPGAAMFTRFAHRTDAMVELLEDAALLMQARCDRLRGVTRAHVATPAQPALVVVVDELAHLTAYGTDPALRKRATQALSLLLSQGRAPAITVVAALQDPRKDVVAFRDLFPNRVALRMVEADQTRLVLGSGAHDRGAACELIPPSLPGVGYVYLDGRRHPTRVRAAWVSDDDIAATADRYPAPAGAVTDLDPQPQPVDGEGATVVELVEGTV